MSKEKDVDTWATITAEISIASVNIKCRDCDDNTMKVPNQIVCATCGNLIKEVKRK